MTNIHFHGRTDVGKRREHNEDTFGVVTEENLFIVADGLGGYAAGEIASKLAVDAVGDFFRALRDDDGIPEPEDMDGTLSYAENVLVNAVITANRRVFSAAARYGAYRGMSTTIVSAHFRGHRVHIAHVGDSRAYCIRNGQIIQLTQDHSLLNAFMQAGEMTAEEIERFPYKNVILRAVGQKEVVEVEVTSHHWAPGDVYLLCSDGLSGEMTDAEILATAMRFQGNPKGLTRALIATANDSGGRDNITALVIEVPQDHLRPIMPGGRGFRVDPPTSDAYAV